MSDTPNSTRELNKLSKAELIAKLASLQKSEDKGVILVKDDKPRMKIRINSFNGVDDDIDAVDWIELYELLTEEAFWPDLHKVRHLPSYLKGVAAKWYFSTIKGRIDHWETVKESFSSQFGACDKPSLEYINNLIWNPENESLIKYYQNKLSACSRAGLRGPLVIDALTGGLPDSYKIQTRMLDPKSEPQVWFDLVHRVHERSKTKESKKVKSHEINYLDKSKETTQGEITSLKQDISELKSIVMSLATKMGVSMNEKARQQCQHCHKVNHASDRCFKVIGYPTRKKENQLNQKNSDEVNNIDDEEVASLNEQEINKIETSTIDTELQNEINHLDFVELFIEDKIKVLALIDSGANISAIDQQICVDNNIPIVKRESKLIGATSKINSPGIANVRVKNGDKIVNIEAIVLDLARQKFILGRKQFHLFDIELKGPNIIKQNQTEQIPTINSVEELVLIEELNTKYKEAFGSHDFNVGLCNLVTCQIRLEGNTKPINSRPRRLSLALQKEEESQIQELLDNKLIRPSYSNWASGITFAIREGRRPRLCGDYRYLNQKTIPDCYPIPNIENILLQFKGATIYSTLDVVRGYNHIEIREQHRYLTAFTTNIGLFEWNRMPFGLKNAPAIFQRLMDRILKTHHDYCRVYFDDIIVYSNSISSHLIHLENIYKTLIKFKIKLKYSKCQFLKESVTFCGYQVNGNKITRDSKFLEAIQAIERPKDIKTLQSFLGLANYGRRFIANFADLSKPLNDLRKKNVQWKWENEHEKAFMNLKKLLIELPELYLFDHRLDTVLFCDASQSAIAGVLCQKADNLRVVGYYSKTLTQTQTKYNIYTKELLAIVKSVEFFKQFLHGIVFKVHTDNSALAFFKSSKQVLDKYTRWLLFLEEFNIIIEHISGNQNTYADALTRLEQVRTQVNTLESDNKQKSVLKPEDVYRVLTRFHKQQGNHIGANKLSELVREKYKIKNLDELVELYLSKCKACQNVNQHTRRMGYSRPKPPGEPNTRWYSDLLGPFPVSNGKTTILVIIDHSSRFAQAHLMNSTTGESMKSIFELAFRVYGRPLTLVTDNESAFRSAVFKKFLQICGVEHILTPAHHSAANGIAERFNKTLLEALIKYSIDDPSREWSERVDEVVQRYNSTKHRVTKFKPVDLLNRTVDFSIANARTIKQQSYDANRTNRKRTPAYVRLGDKVLIDVPHRFQKKYAPRRQGPFKVTKLVNKEVFVTDREMPGVNKGASIHAKNTRVLA